MSTYNVKTDLDPDALTELVMDTWEKWVTYAVGGCALGGYTLRSPSGRYAASISWRKTGAYSFTIMADPAVAPEATWIEDGHPAFDLRSIMLSSSATKVDAEGYRYREIPIRRDGMLADVPNGFDITEAAEAGGLPKGMAKVWAHRANVDADHFAVMSERPGARPWIIPPMPAFSPARILSDLLRGQYGAQQ